MSTAGFPTTVASFGLIENNHLGVEKIAREVEAVQGYVNSVDFVDLTTGFILATGAPMAVFADGASAVPGTECNNSEGFAIRWNNNATHNQVMTTFKVPADADVSADFTVRILASKSGATDADDTTFDVAVYNQVVGALLDADANYGGTTSAMVGTATAKTIQSVSLALATANLPAVGNSITLFLKPTNGTLATDDVSVSSVVVEYTKKHNA